MTGTCEACLWSQAEPPTEKSEGQESARGADLVKRPHGSGRWVWGLQPQLGGRAQKRGAVGHTAIPAFGRCRQGIGRSRSSGGQTPGAKICSGERVRCTGAGGEGSGRVALRELHRQRRSWNPEPRRPLEGLGTPAGLEAWGPACAPSPLPRERRAGGVTTAGAGAQSRARALEVADNNQEHPRATETN